MAEELEIKLLRLHPRACLPTYAHAGDTGDLCADLKSVDRYVLSPGDVKRIGTGIALQFPAGFGALIEDRSGLASRGLSTLAGVIDPGYRGEIQVVLANIGPEPITIEPGDRVAQLRIVKRIAAKFIEVTDLEESRRGSRGFGSTGT